MLEETFRAFLERRKRELTNKRAAAAAAVDEIDKEMHEVEVALNRYIANAPTDNMFMVRTPDTFDEGIGRSVVIFANDAFGPRKPVDSGGKGPTIRQMIQHALTVRFREGATAAQLTDFCRDVFGRDIAPDSMRAQLARSKSQGMVEQRAGEGWFLTTAGKMFDHPTSWPEDKE
jgi:hypothetical protein